MSESLRIGFLGAGKMATALARGWLNAGLTTPNLLSGSDPLESARDAFAKSTGATAYPSNDQVVSSSDIVFLAVKPQMMPGLLGELASKFTPQHLIVSIAAGITLGQIGDTIGRDRRIIRVMPNTPCLVGASASAFAGGSGATEEDLQCVERLLNSVGRAVRVPEKWLDAVTGLSGSGPAFVAIVIEALADGGVRMGLPRDLAQVLAAQTLLGSAKMILETGMHPGQLKDMVASPAGTTIAGLHELERGGLRGALMDAVEAATQRAVELGKPGV